MPARRMKSLRQGMAGETDGVVWHREHRSKKNRSTHKWDNTKKKDKLVKDRKKARKDKLI